MIPEVATETKVRTKHYVRKYFRTTPSRLALIVGSIALILIGLKVLTIFRIQQDAEVVTPIVPKEVKRHTYKSEERSSQCRIEQTTTVISWEPRVFQYHNFLSDKECDDIIAMGKGKVQPVYEYIKETNEYVGSENARQKRVQISKKRTKWLDERIALVTHVPPENIEKMNLIRYNATGDLGDHVDYFIKGQNPTVDMYIRRSGYRIATFLLYLNDVEGGETYFKKTGLAVNPKKGDALLFYSLDLMGKLDPDALHASKKIKKGEKWIATKFLRQKKYVDEHYHSTYPIGHVKLYIGDPRKNNKHKNAKVANIEIAA
jgi:cation transport regulator ChaC